MSPLDTILKARYTDAVMHRPLPLYYRFSHNTAERMVLPRLLYFSLEGVSTGHIWGIPFVVDDDVPDQQVQLTRDFASWEVLS